MRACLFFVFALLALVCAQNTERFLIDDFTVNQGQNVTLILSQAVTQSSPNVIQGNHYYSQNCNQTALIGCGRNMRIEVFIGENQRQFTSNIFPSTTFDFRGEWDISNPKGGTSITYNVYDGNTADFTTINTVGLGASGVDFTEGGLSIGLRFALISDLASTFSVDIYDISGVVCTGSANFNTLPGQYYTEAQITDDILFSNFQGNCDKTRIGAVEIQVPSQDAVDAIVYQVRGVGFPNPSASATPSNTPAGSPSASNSPQASSTPTAVASQSNAPSRTPQASNSPSAAASQSNTPSNTPAASITRTPAASQSNTPAASSTPSATPSNSGPCIVFCKCPDFSCVILYGAEGAQNNIDFNFVPGDSVQFTSRHSGGQSTTTVFVTGSFSSSSAGGHHNHNKSSGSALMSSIVIIGAAIALLM